MYEFDTPQPPRLRIEIGSGEIEVEATQTDRTTVEITAREDDAGRDAHLNGQVAQGLSDNADLFAEAPSIEQVDVLASK